MDKKELFYSIARPNIRDLEEYDPGPVFPDLVRISSNENNLGVSGRAIEAIKNAASECNRYGDSRCDSLRDKLARKYGMTPGRFVIGNGLDGVFTMLGRAFIEPGDEVVCGELTFSVYAETAEIMGGKAVKVPMPDDMELDVDGFVSAVTDKTRMVVFCNPNNPTGTGTGIVDIRKMLDAIPEKVLFVLDEAYIEFADENTADGMTLLDEYPNLMVCRTFSKVYGLAGLRVGWVAGDEDLMRYLYKVREPYVVSVPAAAGAEAALDDIEFLSKSVDMARNEKKRLYDFFRSNSIKFIPSQTNFILLPLGDLSAPLRDGLLEEGIIVRLLRFRSKGIIRITVGLPEENTLLMEKFMGVYREAKCDIKVDNYTKGE
ncbi:MAG TPA: histidinol-phosphate transaminase [Synergistaceae bacterium]|nr:histidinol-phosphate transaminase [Synergistaceae bacterium]